MSWIDGINQAAYAWINQVIQSFTPGGSNNEYSNPDDPSGEEYEWVSIVEFGTPLRQTKCVFVPEMNDEYSEEELNTIYHSADEYRHAVDKYGLIYKSMKFSNATTPQELFNYAKDWIKNNYHGGITNFNVTALDLHLTDAELQKFTVGRRVDVHYIDPATRNYTNQILTIISAEYDLNNPDKNSYKIGIPDVSLNKVYGETSKKGGGGGGSGKPSDQTDVETDTEVEQLIDNAEADAATKLEYLLTMWFKGQKNGDEDYQVGDKKTPSSQDPTSDWMYGLKSDFLKTANLGSNIGDIKNLFAQVFNCSGKASTESLEATESITGKDGIFDTMKIDGKTVKFGTKNGKPQLTINGHTYTLAVDE